MTSYWIKHFVDTRNETGKDADLMSGRASWANGRLEGMTAATLFYAGVTIKVSALSPGAEIWQKDKYASLVGGNLPATRIARGLGLQITEYDVGKVAYLDDEGHHTHRLELADKVSGNHIAITLEDVGKWLVVMVSRVGTVGLLIKEKYRV